jgi:hypothetical protein
MKSLREQLQDVLYRQKVEKITPRLVEIAEAELALAQIPRQERDEEVIEMLLELREEFEKLEAKIEEKIIPNYDPKACLNLWSKGRWVSNGWTDRYKGRKSPGSIKPDEKWKIKEIYEFKGLSRWAGYLLWQDDLGFGEEAVNDAHARIAEGK